MPNICVFLSSRDLEEKYTKPAVELGQLLAKKGYNFIYGGSEKGLMKLVSGTVQAAGGRVIGVSVELFKQFRKLDADEMIITPDLPARKKLIIEKSDAFVILVGGIGTLDEVSDILELKNVDVTNKPVIFLNTDNFYGGLQIQLQRMDEEGFLMKPLADLVYFAQTPVEVMNYLESQL